MPAAPRGTAGNLAQGLPDPFSDLMMRCRVVVSCYTLIQLSVVRQGCDNGSSEISSDGKTICHRD